MQVPFIQLFRTPNRSYFLDVNKNEFIPISEPSFRYLSALMSGKCECEAPETHELSELQAQGYLASQSAVKEIRHVYS